MKTLGCPPVPHSVLILLMLLPSLRSTGNILYQYHDWENYPELGLGSRNFHHHEDQSPRHMWHRRNSKQKPCQATPDVYFVLDKSEDMSRGWPHVLEFVEDMVQRLSNQNLRVSLITYSCKGNIILPITGDREEILKGIERIRYSMPAGHAHLYRGLMKANRQIKKTNSGGVYRPSMIISVLYKALPDDYYNSSLEEADEARKMGASVYCAGETNSRRNQVIGIAGTPENAFPNMKFENLKDLINPIVSKACPSLKSLDTQIICVRESTPVVLRGYGFDFVMHKEDVICRFYFNDTNGSFKDIKAFNLTATTVTCPGPIVEQPGEVIHVLLSLDNGRNFLNENLSVSSKQCDKNYSTDKTTATTTTTRRPTTTTHTTTTTTTTTTTPSTTTTKPPRTTTTKSPTTIPTTLFITEEMKPNIDKFIFAPILLALLLTLLLTGCFWQLCCLPAVEELPPPKPQPQPREEKQAPPPAPAPPVNPPPIVIVCCCTCGSLCVRRDMEGNVAVYNFNPLSCHQLPLVWRPQTDDQGRRTNFAFLKALCAPDPCGPRVILPPSQECLPLASYSQGH